MACAKGSGQMDRSPGVSDTGATRSTAVLTIIFRLLMDARWCRRRRCFVAAPRAWCSMRASALHGTASYALPCGPSKGETATSSGPGLEGSRRDSAICRRRPRVKSSLKAAMTPCRTMDPSRTIASHPTGRIKVDMKTPHYSCNFTPMSRGRGVSDL